MTEVLRLNFEGANGSATITDEHGHACAAIGNAAISTAQFYVGASSAHFDGSDDAIIVSDSADFTASGDFTVEFNIYPTSFSNLVGIFAYTSQYKLRIDDGTFGGAGKLVLVLGTVPTSVISSQALNVNQWNFIVWQRKAGVHELYINGIADGTYSESGIVNPGSSDGIVIGADAGSGGAMASFNGYMDDVILTVDQAKYPLSAAGAVLTRLAVETLSTSDVSAALSRLVVEVLSPNKLRKRPITFLILD